MGRTIDRNAVIIPEAGIATFHEGQDGDVLLYVVPLGEAAKVSRPILVVMPRDQALDLFLDLKERFGNGKEDMKGLDED